jgi:hypothetical protein
MSSVSVILHLSVIYLSKASVAYFPYKPYFPYLLYSPLKHLLHFLPQLGHVDISNRRGS